MTSVFDLKSLFLHDNNRLSCNIEELKLKLSTECFRNRNREAVVIVSVYTNKNTLISEYLGAVFIW